MQRAQHPRCSRRPDRDTTGVQAGRSSAHSSAADAAPGDATLASLIKQEIRVEVQQGLEARGEEGVDRQGRRKLIKKRAAGSNIGG
jgi:hypothetical protein